MNQPRGRLDVIATPIGNLGDLSDRARASLAAADVIAAEDTRRTLGLLQSLGLSKPLVSLHSHNESERVPELLTRLAQGAVIALVSDAGTPLLSDPGAELVSRAVAGGFTVRPIPGPSAITAALAVSGLPLASFCFEGFLPATEAARRARLRALAHEPRTMVFFEAPHRIAASLVDLATALGGTRRACIARELTKLHETIYRGTLAELAQSAGADASLQRGELTLVVQGAPAEPVAASAVTLERALELLLRELPPSKAAALAAQLTGARRNTAYALAMQLARREAPQAAAARSGDTPPEEQ
ncbi:MAG TPA: 16S rRNA (cytidine(1402)-2'-O)-methyltransferase [Steroidobacteraceae bacterium]|nr:16S rRNA (cytidine(1402)-2'-O)-methyltransferase [Steroidobacteraceae bacterium]